MPRLTRQGDPGCLGPIILVTSFAPLKFSAVLGFYDMAWVTPAIIYVWSMFGENLLGAGSGVNTEQPPHKNCFPQEFKGACPNIVRLSCPTASARVESWGSAKETLTQIHLLGLLTGLRQCWLHRGAFWRAGLALWSALLCARHAAEVKIYRDGRLRRRTKLGKWLWDVFLTCDELFPIVTSRNPVKVRSKPGRLTTVGRMPKWSVTLQWLL